MILMPKFGLASTTQRDTLHPGLQAALDDVIIWLDFSVREGHRTDDRQTLLFLSGRSKARAGESKHNRKPSWAVDVYPYPLTKAEFEEFIAHGKNAGPIFARFSGLAHAIMQAARKGYICPETGRRKYVELRWGGDWDQDGMNLGKGFLDAPHVEIVREYE
jgi:peptidoglycan L-alanyl-D-glutamate endopeptidase CwlK